MSTLKKFFTRKRVVFTAAVLALVAAILLGLCIGPVRVPLKNVLAALFGFGGQSSDARIVLYVRLPRTLAAVGAGAALAVSGALLQSALANPLASGSVIGVNAGGGVMTLLAAAFIPSAFIARPLFAFVGAVAAALIVYGLSVKSGAGKTTILLAGVALSGLLTAVVDLLVTLFPALGIDRLSFTVGGFSGASMNAVLPALVVIGVGLVAAGLLSFELNPLSLGEEVAASLGMRVKTVKFASVLTAALLAGAAVSMAGLIGFVGLIVPNLLRLLIGQDNRVLIPLSAFFGAAFTALCDLVARTAFAPFELPVGILLAFIGAPFFFFLLMRQRKGGKRRAK